MKQFSGYEKSVEEKMVIYFCSLSEDHRRRYVAVEALKIGRSGISYIARLFGMSRSTLYTGIQELEQMADDGSTPPKRPSGDPERIRRRGGGRPKATQSQSGLTGIVDCLLEAHAAGSPTDPKVRWTHLTPGRVAQALTARGWEISRNTAAKLMRALGFRRRALRRELITGRVDPQEREQQFRRIVHLRSAFQAHGQPVFCVDTKKKELIGTLHRPGTCYGTGTQKVYDHDVRHLAKGKAVPSGVYDPVRNQGAMTLGTSHETSEFVCDSIALAWTSQFRTHYPHAKEALLTFDVGGANAVNSHRFKEDLLALSRRLGLRLRIAHYPPYTSKWHPIEHRLFSQVERSLRGVMLDSMETFRKAVEDTTTTTGLTVTARILDAVDHLERKCSASFREFKDRFIRHDEILGKWNYIVDANGVS
jgi:hypothetical protein